jgi:two-component system chemotaxis response regulator CheB
MNNQVPSRRGLHCLIVIGASTGGTRTLAELVSQLPPLPACMVIVQHMPLFINESLARTLANHTSSQVRLARDGDVLQDGLILLAPSGVHCYIEHNHSIRLAEGEKVNYVCPSIDVTMLSVTKPISSMRLAGVLLTGMGKDGAVGLAHIRKAGGLTIAQNKATCAVYGMPAEAVKLGAVMHELPPDAIAQKLANFALHHPVHSSVAAQTHARI